jgi:hypothetical protein
MLHCAQAGAIPCQEQRAVIEILRTCDEALHFLGAQHDRQAQPRLRIRQVLTCVAPLQHVAAEAAQRADLRDHRPHGEPPLFEEIQVIAPELRRCEAVEACACMLTEGFNGLDVTADGRGGVVATNELVAQALP